jgi:hypothetical protein
MHLHLLAPVLDLGLPVVFNEINGEGRQGPHHKQRRQQAHEDLVGFRPLVVHGGHRRLFSFLKKRKRREKRKLLGTRKKKSAAEFAVVVMVSRMFFANVESRKEGQRGTKMRCCEKGSKA